MNPHVNTISNRLSLRPPQRDSLEILARVCEIVPLQKDSNTAQALDIIKSEFPTVEDFEREQRASVAHELCDDLIGFGL